ncbi:MAG TPA: hypothetical protein VM073_04210 [Usitatibacter sp.]|nr:hypothetical protein [Usitatibacter sp.]
MNTKLVLALALSAVALTLAACGKEASAPAATAPKKEEPKKDGGRPMPPSAPTAAPAEGEKK